MLTQKRPFLNFCTFVLLLLLMLRTKCPFARPWFIRCTSLWIRWNCELWEVFGSTMLSSFVLTFFVCTQKRKALAQHNQRRAVFAFCHQIEVSPSLGPTWHHADLDAFCASSVRPLAGERQQLLLGSVELPSPPLLRHLCPNGPLRRFQGGDIHHFSTKWSPEVSTPSCF